MDGNQAPLLDTDILFKIDLQASLTSALTLSQHGGACLLGSLRFPDELFFGT